MIKCEILKYGFVDFEGNKWHDDWVDSYNNVTKIIKNIISFYNDGYPPKNSLAEKELNFFLDQRHRFFMQFLDLSRK